jgi:type I restriction enzyme, S subunit
VKVWPKTDISKVYLALFDGPHATPKPSESGKIFLRIENITDDGHLDLSDPTFISDEEYPRWTKRVIPKPGDIVFSYEATLGRYAIIPSGFQGCLGRRIALIRPDNTKAFFKYLYYYFFSQLWNEEVSNYLITGATVNRIPLIKFPKFQICLPPLPIQRKISAVLSAYDDLIENNTRRISILEKMAKDLYREWFVRLRFPGHEKTKIVKGVPEGWRTSTLSDVCDIITRGVSPKYDDNSPYYVINQKCVRNAKIDLSEARRHSSKVPHYKFLKYGDVLINSTGVGTLGRVSAVEFEIAETTCDSHVSICRTDIKKASIHYLAFFLKGLQSHFESSATGATGQTELNRTEIGRTNILLPSKPLQDAFSKTISPIWELKRSLDLALQKLTTSRDSLLSRFMSGKIDLEHLDIQFPPSMRVEEPAHA